MKDTRVFVSYTQRDGVLTRCMLDALSKSLSEVCQPFVHALDAEPPRFPQLRVLKKLLGAHAIILVETPEVQRSPWVRLELLIAGLKMMPVVRIPAERLRNITLVEQTGHFVRC